MKISSLFLYILIAKWSKVYTHYIVTSLSVVDSMQKRYKVTDKDNVVFDITRGEIVDCSTGLVLEERLPDFGPDWRAFSEEERLVKEHAAPLKTRAKGVSSVKAAVLALIRKGLPALDEYEEYGVSKRTMKSLYNKLTSTLPITLQFRERELNNIIDVIVYRCLLYCSGYPEESVYKSVKKGKGPLANIARELKQSILNIKVQGIFKLIRENIRLPEISHNAVTVRIRGSEVKLTVQGLNLFNDYLCKFARISKLKCTNIFLKLPKSIRISLPLAARVFGVGLRYDGRVIAHLDIGTVHIHSSAVNIYGRSYTPEHLMARILPRVFWAATILSL